MRVHSWLSRLSSMKFPAAPPRNLQTNRSLLSRISFEEIVCKAIAGFVLLTAPWSSLQNAMRMGSLGDDSLFPDFNAMFLAGRLAAANRLADAYSWPTMAALEKAEGLRNSDLMPFSYPPPYAFAMVSLANLPSWLAYCFFVLTGLVLFIVVLRRISEIWTWSLVAALAPTVWINVVVGQNGLLFAGLVGLSVALVIRGRGSPGGAVAGLIGAMKPQVAIALPLFFLIRRDWRAFVLSASVATAIIISSIMISGPSVVTSFLSGLAETSQALALGRFPLHRMTSVYAFLRSFGVPATTALALHATTAAAVFSLAWFGTRHVANPRTSAGLVLMTTAFVSPYYYDYDGPVMGLGLVLILPALVRSGARWRTRLPLAAFGLATASGMMQLGLEFHRSLGAPLLLVCFGSVLMSLTGDRRRNSDSMAPALLGFETL